jgi:hypothetical protein
VGTRKPAAATVVAAILDETDLGPVDLNLRCRNGRNKWLKLHRRFDGYERAMFIVGEEPQCTVAPPLVRSASACFMPTK